MILNFFNLRHLVRWFINVFIILCNRQLRLLHLRLRLPHLHLRLQPLRQLLIHRLIVRNSTQEIKRDMQLHLAPVAFGKFHLFRFGAINFIYWIIFRYVYCFRNSGNIVGGYYKCPGSTIFNNVSGLCVSSASYTCP